MREENFDPVEYLHAIKMRQSELMIELYRSDRIVDYILRINSEMLEKYPEMVLEVVDNNDQGRDR